MIIFSQSMIDLIIAKLLKLFARWFPDHYFRFHAKYINDISPEKVNAARILFGTTDRIAIFPHDSRNGRGFSLILDNKLALFFLQYDDAFRYDGMETGKYKKGDITIFDQLPKNKKGQQFRDLSEKDNGESS